MKRARTTEPGVGNLSVSKEPPEPPKQPQPKRSFPVIMSSKQSRESRMEETLITCGSAQRLVRVERRSADYPGHHLVCKTHALAIILSRQKHPCLYHSVSIHQQSAQSMINMWIYDRYCQIVQSVKILFVDGISSFCGLVFPGRGTRDWKCGGNLQVRIPSDLASGEASDRCQTGDAHFFEKNTVLEEEREVLNHQNSGVPSGKLT